MISINVNSAASASGLNLGKTNNALQKSLQRLSSGSRIVNSSDDAGGLAVSMKMGAALRRTEATSINLQNAQSFLQTQDGAFKVADKTLSRMSELATLANDPTKNKGDISLYNKEFQQLQDQITNLSQEKFNGVDLFSSNNDSLSVSTSEDGVQTLDITKSNIVTDPMMKMMLEGYVNFPKNPLQHEYVTPLNFNSGDKIYKLPSGEEFKGFITSTTGPTPAGGPDSEGNFTFETSYTLEIRATNGTTLIEGPTTVTYSEKVPGIPNLPNPPTAPPTPAQKPYKDNFANQNLEDKNSSKWGSVSQLALQSVASMRAQNGAEESRINFAQDLLKINAINLEAANSRIIDVDVAAESTQLARYQILQQAGTAMLAQANTSQQTLVRLLQG